MPTPKSRRAPPRRSATAPRPTRSLVARLGRAKKAVAEALVTPQEQQERQVLSHEEKHQLILAHAARHAAHQQGWGIGYSIAILASCLVVVSGWWLTLDTNVRRSLSPTPDTSWQEVQGTVDEVKEAWNKTIEEKEVGTLMKRLNQAEQELIQKTEVKSADLQ